MERSRPRLRLLILEILAKWKESNSAGILACASVFLKGASYRQESLHPITPKPGGLGTPVPVPHKRNQADFRCPRPGNSINLPRASGGIQRLSGR